MCVDGVIDNNLCHTNEDASAWLQLDLGSSKQISEVHIWNRQSGSYERLGSHQIWVSDSSTVPTTKCFEGTAASVKGPFNEACEATGRYVRIVQHDRTSWLNLAEVKVYLDAETCGTLTLQGDSGYSFSSEMFQCDATHRCTTTIAHTAGTTYQIGYVGGCSAEDYKCPDFNCGGCCGSTVRIETSAGTFVHSGTADGMLSCANKAWSIVSVVPTTCPTLTTAGGSQWKDCTNTVVTSDYGFQKPAGTPNGWGNSACQSSLQFVRRDCAQGIRWKYSSGVVGAYRVGITESLSAAARATKAHGFDYSWSVNAGSYGAAAFGGGNVAQSHISTI
jgi:hypothetical protein